jgi:multicomponent Na+:H+ antiporter subunit C
VNGGALVFAVTGALLVALGTAAFVLQRHVLRRIVALNVLGSGTFLVLVGLAQRLAHRVPDPVPQAMVLTGIVVAVCATAFALVLFRRWHALTGATDLDAGPPQGPR